jgi:hypothetical protein
MISTSFLSRIWWEERWLEFEADGRLDLPSYAGSTIRGAIGAVVRPELCSRGGTCGERCEDPAGCRFYSLFEQSRADAGHGANQPKPLIQKPPLAEGLRAIALGAPVELPFQLLLAQPLPDLVNTSSCLVPLGGRVITGLRALGSAAPALHGIVEGIRRHGLNVHGGSLRLAAVRAARGALCVPAPIRCRHVRVALTTPTLIGGENGVSFLPHTFAARLLDQSFVRAIRIYNAFFAAQGEIIPFIRPQWPDVISRPTGSFATG